MRKSDVKTPLVAPTVTSISAVTHGVPIRQRHRGVALPIETLPEVAPDRHSRQPHIAHPPSEQEAAVDCPRPTEKDGKSGYMNPPLHTRFQKGVSGNPRGRPKNSRNTATIFNDESDTRITVTENGKTLRLTKRELVLKGVVNKAAKGEPKSVATYLKLDERYRPADPKDILSDAAQIKVLMEEDAAILAHYGIGLPCAEDSQEESLEPTTPI